MYFWVVSDLIGSFLGRIGWFWWDGRGWDCPLSLSTCRRCPSRCPPPSLSSMTPLPLSSIKLLGQGAGVGELRKALEIRVAGSIHYYQSFANYYSELISKVDLFYVSNYCHFTFSVLCMYSKLSRPVCWSGTVVVHVALFSALIETLKLWNVGVFV